MIFETLLLAFSFSFINYVEGFDQSEQQMNRFFPEKPRLRNFRKKLLKSINQSINQNLFMTKKYIQPILDIKHKVSILLTLVDLKVLFRGCSKFEFQY